MKSRSRGKLAYCGPRGASRRWTIGPCTRHSSRIWDEFQLRMAKGFPADVITLSAADAYLARGSRDAVRHHAVQAYTREEQPEQSEPDRQRRQYPVRVPARRLTFTSRALRRDSIEAFSSLRPPDHSLRIHSRHRAAGAYVP